MKTKFMCPGGQWKDLHLATGQTITQSNVHKYLRMKISREDTLHEVISDRKGYL